MHRKAGEGSRRHGTSSERKVRRGLGIPFLLNAESKRQSSSSQSSRPSESSQQNRRSSFDRTRSPHHGESRPVPMQDTSPSSTPSMSSQSLADFRSLVSLSSRSNMASSPADDVSMSSEQDSSSPSLRSKFSEDSAQPKKQKKKGGIICVKCGLRFKDVAEMQKHDTETHLRVQTFECPVCHLTFRDASNANKHFRAVHEGRTKGTKCKLCDKPLSSPESLNRHMKNIHHNVRDIPCPKCGMKFKQGAHMRKHVETQHRELFDRHSRTRSSSRRDSNVEHSSRASSSRGFR